MKVFLIKGYEYKNLQIYLIIILAFLFLAGGANSYAQIKFEENTDIGIVKYPGSIKYNSIEKTYRVTGSGENMWGKEDAFFYSWTKASGDLFLKTEIKWTGKGKQPHRKAGWMIRLGLEKDDPYIDAVCHGSGLISLQFRKTKGGTTAEIQSPIEAPATMILERNGNQFSLTVIKNNQVHPIGTISVEMSDEIYAGLAVCSHDSTTEETAIFSNLELKSKPAVETDKRITESILEVIDINTGIRSIVRSAKEHFEAPNWSRDGETLYYNMNGKIYNIPVNGGTPKIINTESENNCNNDHGISPNGKELVISSSGQDGNSKIYILPIQGGKPKQVTKLGPSYWHGWSPDGNTLAYCAERNGDFDVYTIPINGGDEIRLTNAKGLDDGPDYSPDGKFIYFNSVRTGQMKIWRMNTDGSEQTQIIPNDDYGDWFAHPSPDGKWLIFVSYDKSVEGHPANKDVVLRIMPTAGGEPKILAHLFGGQGTMNVPSWSPDSKRAAFVSYRLVTP